MSIFLPGYLADVLPGYKFSLDSLLLRNRGSFSLSVWRTYSIESFSDAFSCVFLRFLRPPFQSLFYCGFSWLIISPV